MAIWDIGFKLFFLVFSHSEIKHKPVKNILQADTFSHFRGGWLNRPPFSVGATVCCKLRAVSSEIPRIIHTLMRLRFDGLVLTEIDVLVLESWTKFANENIKFTIETDTWPSQEHVPPGFEGDNFCAVPSPHSHTGWMPNLSVPGN